MVLCRYGARVHVADSARIDAKMLGINHYGYILGAKGLDEGLHNLSGQALLYLRTFSIKIDDAVHFAQANYSVFAQISDVGAADDGHKMVFTGRVDDDVFFHQHFAIMVVVLKRIHVGGPVGVKSAKGLFNVHFCHSPRGSAQAVVLEVHS